MAHKKRGRNFTTAEQNLLIELLDSNDFRNVVEDKRTNCSIVKKKADTWRRIAEEFSSHGHGFRTADELKALWKRQKIETKKKLTENKREVRLTGGGISSATPISPRTKRIAGLIAPDELTPPLTTELDCDALAMACADISVVLQDDSCVGREDSEIPMDFQQQLQPSSHLSPKHLQNEHLKDEDPVNATLQHRKGMSAFHTRLLSFAEKEHHQKMINLKLEEELLRKKLDLMKN